LRLGKCARKTHQSNQKVTPEQLKTFRMKTKNPKKSKKKELQPKNKEKRTEFTKKKKSQREVGIENATHQCIFRGAKSKAKESIAKPIFPPPFPPS